MDAADYPYRLMLSPSLVLFVPFYVSLLFVFGLSLLTYDRSSLFALILTAGNYRTALTDTFYLIALWKTLKISFFVTLTCVVMGYPIAYHIVRTQSAPLRAALLAVVVLPFMTNALVRLFAWTTILGREGIVSVVLFKLGLIAEKTSYLRTEYAVIIGLVYFLLPFTILTLTGVLTRINNQLEQAAQTLGANEWQAFRAIVLPLSMPGVLASCLITYSLSASAFVVPLLLGGELVKMYSNVIYDQVTFAVNVPLASAMAIILLVASMILAYGYQRVLGRAGGGGFGV